MAGMFDNAGQFAGPVAPAEPRAAQRKARGLHALPTRLQVLWSGHLYDHSGYARANRELLFRVANSMTVGLHKSDIPRESVAVDEATRLRLNAHATVGVSPSAPLLRFYTPREEKADRRRICYTMIETETVHPDMVGYLNSYYDEVWTPTRWNRDTFDRAGVQGPIRVMPLGVNPHVFRPLLVDGCPEAELVTTLYAGKKEAPRGCLFVTMCQPTFRKGLDVLLCAFEDAFADDPDAALILLTTVHTDRLANIYYGKDAKGPREKKARVYKMDGRRSDEELATIFNACSAYVSASRGEGWDLPLTEGAACGLPVIASNVSAHRDYLTDENAYLFDAERYAPVKDAVTTCKWYKDQEFAFFGGHSHEQLVEHLREVRRNYSAALAKAERLAETMRTRYTWDRAAYAVVDRLMEMVLR